MRPRGPQAHGMATIAIRNSGHLGRIGAWPETLATHGLASIHFVNTSGFGILVAPFGGSDRRLSANPIAAGVAVKGGRPIILDIATSSVAEGKIQVARNKGEKLPPGTTARRLRPANDRPRGVLMLPHPAQFCRSAGTKARACLSFARFLRDR